MDIEIAFLDVFIESLEFSLQTFVVHTVNEELKLP